MEQALEFGLRRDGATVEAGPFIFERVDAVDEEHVQADRLLGQDVVDEMRGGLGHAACAAARAEHAALATERHELLMPAGFALDAQESVFETPTLEVRLELFHDEVGQ